MSETNLKLMEQYHQVTREIINDIYRPELFCPSCDEETETMSFGAGGYVGVFCLHCQYFYELISDFINWYFGNGHYEVIKDE